MIDETQLEVGKMFYWNNHRKVIVVGVLPYGRAQVKMVNNPDYPRFVAIIEDLSTTWRQRKQEAG